MTDDLQTRLRHDLDGVHLPAGLGEALVRQHRRDHRRRQVVSGVAVLALLAGAGVTRTSQRGDTGDTLASDPVPDVNARLLIREGDLVTGSGRVVQLPGGSPQLCGPEIIAGVGYPPGQEPAPAGCRVGVTLIGVDLRRLSEPRTKDGATEGRASVTGTFRNGSITVTRQGAPVEDTSPGLPTEPPCTPPAGGWPTAGPELEDAFYAADSAYTRFIQTHVDAVGLPRFAHPVSGGTAIVLLARDARARRDASASLRPAFPDRVCVVVARYTEEQAQAAQDDVSTRFQGLGITSAGNGLAADWQRQVHVSLFRVTDDVLALADRHPAGLISLEPSLRPVR